MNTTMAVAAHRPPAHPPEPALPGPDDEEAPGIVGAFHQHGTGRAAHHERLDGQVRGRAAEPPVEGVPEALLGRVPPELAELEVGLTPFGEITTRRNPGDDRNQPRVPVPGLVRRVAQRLKAAQGTVHAREDPPYRGHGTPSPALLPGPGPI